MMSTALPHASAPIEAHTKEVRRVNWGGELPVVIQLASRDVAVASHQAPAPLAMMIPRRSYLPLIVDELVKHFGGAVLPMNAKPSSVWLGCGDSPLPWYERVRRATVVAPVVLTLSLLRSRHLPVGVLYDMFVASERVFDARFCGAAGAGGTSGGAGGSGAGAGAGAGADATIGATSLAGGISELPWRLTVHFQGFPHSVRCLDCTSVWPLPVPWR